MSGLTSTVGCRDCRGCRAVLDRVHARGDGRECYSPTLSPTLPRVYGRTRHIKPTLSMTFIDVYKLIDTIPLNEAKEYTARTRRCRAKRPFSAEKKRGRGQHERATSSVDEQSRPRGRPAQRRKVGTCGTVRCASARRPVSSSSAMRYSPLAFSGEGCRAGAVSRSQLGRGGRCG